MRYSTLIVKDGKYLAFFLEFSLVTLLLSYWMTWFNYWGRWILGQIYSYNYYSFFCSCVIQICFRVCLVPRARKIISRLNLELNLFHVGIRYHLVHRLFNPVIYTKMIGLLSQFSYVMKYPYLFHPCIKRPLIFHIFNFDNMVIISSSSWEEYE